MESCRSAFEITVETLERQHLGRNRPLLSTRISDSFGLNLSESWQTDGKAFNLSHYFAPEFIHAALATGALLKTALIEQASPTPPLPHAD